MSKGFSIFNQIYPQKQLTYPQFVLFCKIYKVIHRLIHRLIHNEDVMPKVRLDIASFSGTKITKEGYLTTNATVTRTGIFLYRDADGSMRRELRHPDDVFKASSLKSMQMIPVTDGHPESKMVNAKTAKELQTGYVGENINVDGRLVKAPITITDESSIAKIKNGKNQLSLGYTADVIEQEGTYNGQHYDCRQKNIIYNHLATVSAARAGSEASIKLDEGEAMQVDIDDGLDNDYKFDNKKLEKKKMPKIILDNIEYEASAEVINAYDKSCKHADELTKQLAEKEGKFDAVSEENKKLKEKTDNADKTFSAKVNAAIKERTSIMDQANKILEKETKLDEMENAEIKKAVILSISKEAKLDGKSEDYINARFDAALEIESTRTDLSEQRKTVGAKEGTTDGSGKSILLDAQEKYLKDLRGEK